MIRKYRKNILFFLLLVFCILFTLVNIHAQESFPNQPIRYIVPFAAGGGTDLDVRLLSKHAVKYIEQPVVVNNITGGSGEIGWVEIKKSKPDGYTLGAFTSSAIMNYLARVTNYHPIEDFDFIGQILSEVRIFVVRSGDDRFHTFKEFIQYAREHPGEITVATAGAGSTGDMAVKLLNYYAHIKLVPVPFSGGGESLSAFLGGHVDAHASSIAESTRHIEEGTIRLIGTLSEERLPQYPDAETAIENGLDLVFTSSRGICAPAGLSEDTRKYLSDKFKDIIKDPDFTKDAEELGMQLKYMTGDEYAEHNKKELETYRNFVEIVKEME